MTNMTAFVLESNRIEGITSCTIDEVEVHNTFITLKEITIADLSNLVNVVQPGAILRDRAGLDVYIGDRTPMKGGPGIVPVLNAILANVNESSSTPYDTHQAYEFLHPFTDGNGRSGRMLWLWMMVKYQDYDMHRSFLHEWYYQSLAVD